MRRKRIYKLLAILLGGCLMLHFECSGIQRKFLFYPTHHTSTNGLSAWMHEGKVIGYSRQVPIPKNVWLMLHGNGGQAADRAYAIRSFSEEDSVFVMEYPGYGRREGKPSRASFDAAAKEAYALLRKTFPNTPVCVVGESIGSGPSCVLATQSPPPNKIILIVPFDKLTRVASHHFRFLPVSLIMEAKWDNAEALSTYKGPVEIFAAQDDTIIPIEHAKRLTDSVAGARFYSIPGGHNDWASGGEVKIRNP